MKKWVGLQYSVPGNDVVYPPDKPPAQKPCAVSSFLWIPNWIIVIGVARWWDIAALVAELRPAVMDRGLRSAWSD